MEKDLLAVDINRCRNALAAKVDEVLLLEHDRAQLQKDFEERRSAVAVGSPSDLIGSAPQQLCDFPSFPDPGVYFSSHECCATIRPRLHDSMLMQISLETVLPMSSQAEKDILQAELKMLRGDVHQAMLELTERTQRASKLQAKYETVCSKSVGVEGADEARSQVSGGFLCPHKPLDGCPKRQT